MHLLKELENNRWNWALNGVEEFKKGFLRLKDNAHKKKRVLIGVYGPTQVGKTTLILKVLCIKEELLTKLSSALRGKRSLGNSATITSTIYRRSSDENFNIQLTNGKEIQAQNLEELETAMFKLRNEIENIEDYSTKPVIIEIPYSYFNEEELNKREQEIEILDLPGDDSREKKEIHHVNLCLKELLPLCRLCIIMEISSQLVAISQMDREYVRDWNYMPSRFRLVLTRSVSSSSIKQKILQKNLYSTKSFRAYFEEELNRCLDGESLSANIYPLEFGDSWNALEHDNPELFESAKPWIEETFQELIYDLSSAYSPRSEIEAVKSLEKYITKKSMEEYQVLEEEKKNLDKNIEDKLFAINSLKIRYKMLNESIKTLEEEKENLDSEIQEYVVGKIDKTTKSTTKMIKSEYYYFQDKINTYYQEQVQKVNKEFIRIARECQYTNKPVLYNKLEKSVAFLDSYVLDSYIWKSNFDRDVDFCQSQLDEINKQIFMKCNEICTEVGQEITNVINLRKKQTEEKIESIKRDIIKNKRAIKNMELLLLKLAYERDRAEIEWNQDIERSNHLNQFLKEAYIRENNRLMSLFSSPHVIAEEKWLYHQYLNLISRDVERIITNE